MPQNTNYAKSCVRIILRALETTGGCYLGHCVVCFCVRLFFRLARRRQARRGKRYFARRDIIVLIRASRVAPSNQVKAHRNLLSGARGMTQTAQIAPRAVCLSVVGAVCGEYTLHLTQYHMHQKTLEFFIISLHTKKGGKPFG